MTRAESFKELLQVLGAIKEGDYNLFVQLESKFNAVQKEFQQEADAIMGQQTKYWLEVVEGKISKYISLDQGKTFFKLTAVPAIPSVDDKVVYLS